MPPVTHVRPVEALFIAVALFVAASPIRQVEPADAAELLVRQQMKLPAQPMVHVDDSTIDVADQAVPENDVGNFPVTAGADIG